MIQNSNIYNICVAKKDKIPNEYHLSPRTYTQAHC